MTGAARTKVRQAPKIGIEEEDEHEHEHEHDFDSG
jgi:hypothetical protein